MIQKHEYLPLFFIISTPNYATIDLCWQPLRPSQLLGVLHVVRAVGLNKGYCIRINYLYCNPYLGVVHSVDHDHEVVAWKVEGGLLDALDSFSG